MKRFASFLFVLCACSGVVLAEAPSDPLAWLGRISTAAHGLNYSGTFTYQSGKSVETSHIVHMVDAGGEYEKLETLDGSPREVVRSNDEVQCFLPDQHLLIVDRSSSRRSFPAHLPPSAAALAENYRIRKGEVVRIAGMEAQQIILEPKDELRFGHQLWADVNSGLLLRARLINEKGESIEQFAFSEVHVGMPFDRDKVKSSFVRNPQWKVVNARGSEVKAEESAWVFHAALPGYRQIVSVNRQMSNDRAETYHVVFSDGLAAVSVFIEPLAMRSSIGQSGVTASGAFNIFRRTVGDHLITVLGEVPASALMRIADGVEMRKK